MRIIDFQSARRVDSAQITLTRAEAEELIIYLRALAHRPNIGPMYLSELNGSEIVRELTLAVDATLDA